MVLVAEGTVDNLRPGARLVWAFRKPIEAVVLRGNFRAAAVVATALVVVVLGGTRVTVEIILVLRDGAGTGGETAGLADDFVAVRVSTVRVEVEARTGGLVVAVVVVETRG